MTHRPQSHAQAADETHRSHCANTPVIPCGESVDVSRPAPVAAPLESEPPEVAVGAIVSPLGQLTPQERAVLDALAARSGRVVSRSELARAVGVADLSERRCDSLVVAVRRAVGAERVVTVRRRGWMLVAA